MYGLTIAIYYYVINIIIIIISLFRMYIKAVGPWYIHFIHLFTYVISLMQNK